MPNEGKHQSIFSLIYDIAMTEEIKLKLQQSLTLDGSIKKILTRKSRNTICETIPHELVEKYTNGGWRVVKEYKKSGVRVEKDKSQDVLFEDEIWCMLAKIGFHILNKDRYFRIPYSSQNEMLTRTNCKKVG